MTTSSDPNLPPASSTIPPAATSEQLPGPDAVAAELADHTDRLTSVEAAVKALQETRANLDDAQVTALTSSIEAAVERGAAAASGGLVYFEVEDPLLSHPDRPVTVSGVGLVVRTLEDGVRVAPLTELQVSIPTDAVTPHDPTALPPSGEPAPTS